MLVDKTETANKLGSCSCPE